MKRIAWYISREFIIYFLSCSISLIFIAITFVALSELEKLETGGWQEFLSTISKGIPLLIEIITPISVLLATVISYIILSRSSEITAMRAAGISVAQLIKPVLISCGFIALFFYFNQSYLAPWWEADKLTNIMKSVPNENIWRFYKGQLYYFNGVSKSHQTAKLGSKFSFDEGFTLKRIDGYDRLKLNNSTWLYEGGKSMRFRNKSIKITDQSLFGLAGDYFPEIFEKELPNAKYSKLTDIVTQIGVKKQGAIDYQDEIFAIYQKTAGVLAVFVMVFLALPFSLFSSRSSNVRIGIVLSVVFRICILVGGPNIFNAL